MFPPSPLSAADMGWGRGRKGTDPAHSQKQEPQRLGSGHVPASDGQPDQGWWREGHPGPGVDRDNDGCPPTDHNKDDGGFPEPWETCPDDSPQPPPYPPYTPPLPQKGQTPERENPPRGVMGGNHEWQEWVKSQLTTVGAYLVQLRSGLEGVNALRAQEREYMEGQMAGVQEWAEASNARVEEIERRVEERMRQVIAEVQCGAMAHEVANLVEYKHQEQPALVETMEKMRGALRVAEEM